MQIRAPNQRSATPELCAVPFLPVWVAPVGLRIDLTGSGISGGWPRHAAHRSVVYVAGNTCCSLEVKGQMPDVKPSRVASGRIGVDKAIAKGPSRGAVQGAAEPAATEAYLAAHAKLTSGHCGASSGAGVGAGRATRVIRDVEEWEL